MSLNTYFPALAVKQKNEVYRISNIGLIPNKHAQIRVRRRHNGIQSTTHDHVYNWFIDQWLEDTPLTYHQEMILKHGGETLEEMLRTDLEHLERLEYWKRKLEEEK